MGAATQFQRIGVAVVAFARSGLRSHGHNAHFVAVFFTKQRLCANRPRVIWRHDPRLNRRVLPDIGVHLRLDPLQLLQRQRLAMAEIKPQPVRRVQ